MTSTKPLILYWSFIEIPPEFWSMMGRAINLLDRSNLRTSSLTHSIPKVDFVGSLPSKGKRSKEPGLGSVPVSLCPLGKVNPSLWVRGEQCWAEGSYFILSKLLALCSTIS